MIARIQPFPPLNAETEAALRRSIERFGVVVPIVVDGAGRIIDGHHRDRIARDLGVDCPRVERLVTNDDDATALALSLNTDRRHLSRDERQQIVADLREQGYSLRAIAGAVGTAEVTVRRDLEIAPSDAIPERVQRQGGGTYPAQRDKGKGGSRSSGPPTSSVTGKDDATSTPRKARRNFCKVVATAFNQIDKATRSLAELHRADLAPYTAEVPVWSGNLADSLKALDAFDQLLKEISA